MPTYEFYCKCEHVQDVVLEIVDRDKIRILCDQCNRRMKRKKFNNMVLLGFDKNGSSKI